MAGRLVPSSYPPISLTVILHQMQNMQQCQGSNNNPLEAINSHRGSPSIVCCGSA
jgi:hypothetical protein